MKRRTLLWILTMSILALGTPAEAKPKPRVTPAMHTAITYFLRAEKAAKEKKELAKAIRLFKGSVATAAEAIRTLPPLWSLRPGTYHDRTFTSGEHEFKYSVRIPKGYDNRKRFPVLVLPDHGSVDMESGIAFWESDKRVDDYVLFRPVIVKHKDDRSIFPDGQFFAIDQAVAKVMRDGLRHLRIFYAVDPDRFRMTGLSQAGYYTWYYGVSFPDQFAALIPESAGGVAVRAAVQRLAPNLLHTTVRILHHPGDQITPYADAKRMHDALEQMEAPVELITYEDKDYPGQPFPKRHPGPHNLRLKHVFDIKPGTLREIPTSVSRVMRYSQQGFEGRWRIPTAESTGNPIEATCTNEDGTLACNVDEAWYRVTPGEIVDKVKFKVGKKTVKPKADLELLLRTFKETGDRGRLVAAEIKVTR